ncbi:MAG: CHC2 zinc finger domain-containing protein [Solirubrobacteraceae bacterium]
MTTAAVSSASDATSALDSYLRALAGPKPGARLLEIRFALRHRDMGRVFLAAHSAAGASRFIRRLAVRTDVYVGVVVRNCRSGGRAAIDRSHLLFIEIDSPDGQQRLEDFAHSPSMLIASGTPGHAHAYWMLRAPIGVLELERANRRLAHHLGGDLASVDSARILRPPSSWNHKHTPPAPVRMLELHPARRYDIRSLVDGLEDPPGRPPRGLSHPRRPGRTAVDQRLLAIPAADYAATLAGLSPDRTGKVACPFHDDHTPSLQLYDDGTWYCFGACQTGGSIYDFASRMWGIGTRGRPFLELRHRLAAELGVAVTT